MKSGLSLRNRFLVGGSFLAIISGTTSLYSAWAFSRVRNVVDRTVLDGERATGVTGALINGARARGRDALPADRARQGPGASNSG